MPSTILGLDIGGANLKAATTGQQAVTLPFALWKQPDRLSAILAELVDRFPNVDGFAVTMTGELCDCYANRPEGVHRILDAVATVARTRPVGIWATTGRFQTLAEAQNAPLAVASANWHALATFAGRYAPNGAAVLVDVGSTTTDVIPLLDGVPVPRGTTDEARFQTGELLYFGVRRTPIAAILGLRVAAELFATTLDAFLVLGEIADDPHDTDTADGRPATRTQAQTRLRRQILSDTASDTIIQELAQTVAEELRGRIVESLARCSARIAECQGRLAADLTPVTSILSGSGEFLARGLCTTSPASGSVVALSAQLASEVSTSAPAYAVAILATERGLP
jgi:probable H4MPT-linked C1 transfer pathway protein